MHDNEIASKHIIKSVNKIYHFRVFFQVTAVTLNYVHPINLSVVKLVVSLNVQLPFISMETIVSPTVEKCLLMKIETASLHVRREHFTKRHLNKPYASRI
jgi:hypothetical protein